MKNRSILLIIVILLVSSNLFSQLPLTKDYKSPFVEVVKNIRESVVNIKVEGKEDVQQYQSPFSDDLFKHFFPESPDQPKSRPFTAMGSGFIFKQKGDEVFIITNNHVIEKGDDNNVTVTLADKAQYTAEIVGLDSASDLAVIKIQVEKNEEIIIAPLGNSDEIEVGDWAIAIGNPFGQLGLERTVTVGVISAKGRSNLSFGLDSPIYQDYIQTDAAINPGNSGGPLVDIKGNVIGVNAAITTPSRGNVGIGFAIPIDLIKKVVSDLMQEGRVLRAFLGIRPQEIDSNHRKSLNLDKIAGVLVAQVLEDTPAEKAGLKHGDVIIEFNGEKVPNVSKFMITVANSEIGKKISIKLIRNGKEKKIFVKLVERDGDRISETEDAKNETAKSLGLEVESLTGEFAERHNIKDKEGVIITGIENAKIKSQLQVGDIILEINQQPVDNISDYKKITKNLKEGVVLLYIKTTTGNYQFVTIDLE